VVSYIRHLRGNLKSVSTPVQETIQISIPKCELGIGKLIRGADSADLIDGVRVKPYDLWPDDRGYFLEVVRMKQGLSQDFAPETTQISAALSYPGTIKAFHFHKHQTDLWVPSAGMFQVALVDLRPESKTFGLKNTIYAGALKPLQILIPPGVGHGYKVIGEGAAILVYVTNRLYNPADEGRIAYNETSIQYDWETQHK
jgi:dTDP-4-dehydrorhamnose 3,5-epimerase